MDHLLPGNMWLDLLPTGIQSRLVEHVTAGYLDEKAVNLAKMGFKWAELVLSAAHTSVLTLRFERKADEEVEALQKVTKEAREAHNKMLALIKCCAERSIGFGGLCFLLPEDISQFLRSTKVTCAHIPLQMSVINDVVASCCIEELHLTVCDSTIRYMLEEFGGLACGFWRLTSLPLKTFRVDGVLEDWFRYMDIPAELASVFALFVSEGSSSCQLIWSIRLPQFVKVETHKKFENYWKSIELIPAATSVVLFHPPPEWVIDKLSSFESLDIQTPLFSSTAVNRLGKIVQAYKGEFRSCVFPVRQGFADLKSLGDCTQLKKLHVTGCWHLLGELAPVIKRMGLLVRLELVVYAMETRGNQCNACGEDPNYLPLTSQFFQSIAHLDRVDFVGRDITLTACKQFLKLLGTKLRRLRLDGRFDSRGYMMDYIEEVLLTLLSCNPKTRRVQIRTFSGSDSSNDHESLRGQESRVRILANKLDRKDPILDCAASIDECLSYLS